MTKEITKAKILQEMQDKLKLREFDSANFLFDETVIPVYNIEPHLLKEEVKHNITSVSSGPVGRVMYTVPWNEKWYMHGYNVIFMTGVYTVAGLMVYRRLVEDYIYIDLAAAQSTSYAVNLPKDVILHPGDMLALYVDGYTSTGNLELRIDATVEEVR